MTSKQSALARQVLPGILGLILAAPLSAQTERLDETTILATGFPASRDDTGLPVNVEEGGALNDAGIWRLNDAILLSPGVNILSNGGHGTASSLFTRGTESDHTAIFVDGVKLSDSRIFPFPTANILSGAGVQPGERIELLRGAQSALYGSDAIGGVLSLSLEQGQNNTADRIWLEGGSFDSVNSGISLQGREDKLSYNAFTSWNSTSNDRPRNDYESIHSGLRLDYALSHSTNIGMTLRVLNFETGLPPLGMTPYASNETENFIYSVFVEHKLTDFWHARLSYSGYESHFTNTGGSGDSSVDTRYQGIHWTNRYIWNQHHETSAGIAVTWLETSNSGVGIDNFSEQNESIYIQHHWIPGDNLNLLAGIRHDQYEGGKDSTTFRAAASWQACDHTKLHTSMATGFRRPSVVDLFGFFGYYGNPNLNPEESLGWDAGVTFDITGDTSLDITYFHNEIDDLIASGPAPDYAAMNIQKARTRGLEVSHRGSHCDGRVRTRLAYTWLQAENLTSSSRLVRRPEHTLNADINADITARLLLGAGITWVSRREDFQALPPYSRYDAEDYATARIYGSYQLSDAVSLKARVENLFNQQYSEVDGFPARGLGFFAGITLEW